VDRQEDLRSAPETSRLHYLMRDLENRPPRQRRRQLTGGENAGKCVLFSVAIDAPGPRPLVATTGTVAAAAKALQSLGSLRIVTTASHPSTNGDSGAHPEGRMERNPDVQLQSQV
jgi:hypothetical protein